MNSDRNIKPDKCLWIDGRFDCGSKQVEKKVATEFGMYMMPKIIEAQWERAILWGTPTAISIDERTGELCVACIEVACALQSKVGRLNFSVYVGDIEHPYKAQAKVEQWNKLGIGTNNRTIPYDVETVIDVASKQRKRKLGIVGMSGWRGKEYEQVLQNTQVRSVNFADIAICVMRKHIPTWAFWEGSKREVKEDERMAR